MLQSSSSPFGLSLSLSLSHSRTQPNNSCGYIASISFTAILPIPSLLSSQWSLLLLLLRPCVYHGGVTTESNIWQMCGKAPAMTGRRKRRKERSRREKGKAWLVEVKPVLGVCKVKLSDAVKGCREHWRTGVQFEKLRKL